MPEEYTPASILALLVLSWDQVKEECEKVIAMEAIAKAFDDAADVRKTYTADELKEASFNWENARKAYDSLGNKIKGIIHSRLAPDVPADSKTS